MTDGQTDGRTDRREGNRLMEMVLLNTNNICCEKIRKGSLICRYANILLLDVYVNEVYRDNDVYKWKVNKSVSSVMIIYEILVFCQHQT